MSHRASVIRVGDTVRILKPTVVVRVGYPKTVDDYLPEVHRLFWPATQQALQAAKMYDVAGSDSHLWKRLRREYAHALAQADGFGGRDRTLHTIEEPELLGRELYVSGVRTVVTGRYYPASGGGYDDDYEPAGLGDEKRHRLVRVARRLGFYELTSDCVEKIASADWIAA